MAPTANAHMSSPKLEEGSIATPWEQLQGSCSWEGLLEPLNADLRASLIAYGELAEAAYDGFDADENSPHAGSCIYDQAGLLAASGVSHPEYYTITKFLNATWEPLLGQSLESMAIGNALFVQQPEKPGRSESRTNWIGYVAVATDEGAKALGRRDIVVAWRGTVKILEYPKDVEFRYKSAAQVLAGDFSDAKVRSGILDVYTTNNPVEKHIMPMIVRNSARDQVLAEVRKQVEAYKEEKTSITVTGHNLGASLATLNAVDIVANGYNVPGSRPEQTPCPVTAILFASPHVGDDNFKSAFASFPALRALHVRNAGDKVPPADENMDVATAVLHINMDRSPYLNLRLNDDVTRHNLECYLHGLAGDQGDAKDFEMVVDRDVALVNKSADALKDDYPVPANWWAINHKHKVKGVVGRWTFDNINDL
ncbi:phospholipase A1-II 7 [Lolium perenne]|uniref:phospholipase A1-II 7 n=1 Tax=Lolium perenne TaxID=4522 RepID=UPI0021EA3EC5|nr:phospholipase A1-II 7-like [Lolium perenne]